MADASDRNGVHGPSEVRDEPHRQSGGPSEASQAVPSSTGGRAPARPSRPGGVRGSRPAPAPDDSDINIVIDMFEQRQAKRTTPPDDDEIRLGYPAVWQLLTMDRYPAGADRFLPEVVINRVDGGYQAELRDHETCSKKTAYAPKLLDVVKALETAVRDPNVPWMPFKSYRNPKGLDRHQEKKG